MLENGFSSPSSTSGPLCEEQELGPLTAGRLRHGSGTVLKQCYTAEYIKLYFARISVILTIRAYNSNIRWCILLLYHYQ